MIRSPEILAKPDDAFALAKLGYQQELKRNFSKLEILSVAFSILGLLPSIASSLVFAIPAGPVGMVWGWFIASGFTFLVSVAMADLGSAMPTAGGLYWWTHYFSAPGWKNPLAFLVGYSNTLGVISGLCSTDYGFALMFLSVVHLAVGDGKDFAPTSGTVYLVFIVCVLSHATVVTFASKIMAKLQVMFMVANVLLIAVTLIVLPVGKRNTNSAEWIFTHSENLSGWPAIWTFFLAWMCPIWSVGGFEACIHLSEEAQNATMAVPWGIMGSCGLSWILGTVIMIVFASSLFSLIAPAAASALFSIGVVGNHLAWFMPIFARIVWGRDKFIPGPFYTGGLSIPIAVVACIFLIFSILTAWMPIDGPNVTPQNMNYAIVVNFAVWGGALLYYYVDARKWFTGPRITLDSSHSQLTEEQEEKIAKEALVDLRH
ncbi:GABA-specific high-affinity permease [Orbilia oligospora]|uniref:GABA-specific high-affinity permease n=1 Tax=Orbilia oligospora TaxID=2813651 RepID=A0A6G1M4T9_ORBOL|nr:GABA-specific high-affinity permease [Orbilia oligospora]KAF3245797.1 GABA-specific high-affinity permease [Orbilia oligospora]